MRQRRRASLLAALAATCALGAASNANAAVVTIGSPLTASFGSGPLCSPVCTFAQTALPGAVIASPVDGIVVRWRVSEASGPGGFQMRVLHPESFGTYTGAGTSAVGTPISFGTQVFTTALPIHAGDLIGLNNTDPSENIGRAPTSSSVVGFWTPLLADGTTLGPNGSGGPLELAFNADVQPLPGISSLSPSSGPSAGGTAVTIAGHDFTGAGAVSFGSAPAASFTVDSDSQITAVSPPGAPGAVVDVTITNPGLSPTAATDKFTYEACVVPNLKGKKLKAAKRVLKAADCRLGKVKPKGQTSGKVKKQKPKAGKVLPAGSKVNVTLG